MSARYAMGTFLRARVEAESGAEAAREEIFREVGDLEAQLSYYRADSDLSRINRAAGGAPVAVRAAAFDAVERALACAQATGGAFDPTFRSPGGGRFDSVELDAAAKTVRLPRPGMLLDLGGFGKGFALDAALAKARARFPISEAVMDFGGQWLFWSRGGAVREMVRIEDPRDEGRALSDFTVERNGSVATSSQGQRPGHLRDPGTGAAARRCLSATAFAPTGAEAEALSTALFVAPERAARILERFPGATAVIH